MYKVCKSSNIISAPESSFWSMKQLTAALPLPCESDVNVIVIALCQALYLVSGNNFFFQFLYYPHGTDSPQESSVSNNEDAYFSWKCFTKGSSNKNYKNKAKATYTQEKPVFAVLPNNSLCDFTFLTNLLSNSCNSSICTYFQMWTCLLEGYCESSSWSRGRPGDQQAPNLWANIFRPEGLKILRATGE